MGVIYVGLTQKAENFVSTLEEAQAWRTVHSVDGQDISLRAWYSEGIWFYETIQRFPEINGDRFVFTCLRFSTGRCFEWVHNPNVKVVYNKETGEIPVMVS